MKCRAPVPQRYGRPRSSSAGGGSKPCNKQRSACGTHDLIRMTEAPRRSPTVWPLELFLPDGMVVRSNSDAKNEVVQHFCHQRSLAPPERRVSCIRSRRGWRPGSGASSRPQRPGSGADSRPQRPGSGASSRPRCCPRRGAALGPRRRAPRGAGCPFRANLHSRNTVFLYCC